MTTRTKSVLRVARWTGVAVCAALAVANLVLGDYSGFALMSAAGSMVAGGPWFWCL